MQVVKLGVAYFGIVFSIGFVLGVVRVLWLVPRLGERYAELIETPFIIGFSYASARLLLKSVSERISGRDALAMGLVALVLLITLELTVVLGLRGLSIDTYLTARDPIAGAVYVLSLGLFALFPAIITARERRHR